MIAKIEKYMKRRTFLKTTSLAITALSLPGPMVAQFTELGKPNFLFLFTDDQTFNSIGSLNNPDVKTPNIDKLVSNGITLTHCFNQGSWAAAVCMPSRAMLNSGKFIYHAEAGIDNTPLWGETLGKAGYDTYVTGKWHNGDTALNKSFKTIGPTGPGMYPSNGTGEESPYNRPAPGNTWSPSDTTLAGHWRTQEDGSVIHSSKLWADTAIDFLTNDVQKIIGPFRTDSNVLKFNNKYAYIIVVKDKLAHDSFIYKGFCCTTYVLKLIYPLYFLWRFIFFILMGLL